MSSGALSFFAYASLGLGPGIVFFLVLIAPKSFLVLLSFFSTFLWLTTLLIISAIFRGFVPLPESQGSYAGLLAASVFMQEGVRVLVWLMHRKSVAVLKGMAASSQHRFWLVDQLYMALGWGFGHAACHATFFFASFLPLTAGSGTYYMDACPKMSLFLQTALYSLSFGMILTSIMVVALDGFESRNWAKVAYAPLMHFGAAFATLGNFKRDGCMVVWPCLLAVGALNVALAVRLAWSKGRRAATR